MWQPKSSSRTLQIRPAVRYRRTVGEEAVTQPHCDVTGSTFRPLYLTHITVHFRNHDRWSMVNVKNPETHTLKSTISHKRKRPNIIVSRDSNGRPQMQMLEKRNPLP
ncbi:hypothetical protein CDAR_407201 [Caerostris darwini]|uniref:Uncharacterized protein n=1 Tax=Caerostris darwini TaxID=1538125 RepID=A0AAV4Q315_9ARAC|nr:hypothetical protein CDAR_407201 [Caerostris darwini]